MKQPIKSAQNPGKLTARKREAVREEPADPEEKRGGETEQDAKARRSNQAGDQDVADANGEIPDPPDTSN